MVAFRSALPCTPLPQRLSGSSFPLPGEHGDAVVCLNLGVIRHRVYAEAGPGGTGLRVTGHHVQVDGPAPAAVGEARAGEGLVVGHQGTEQMDITAISIGRPRWSTPWTLRGAQISS